MNPLSAASKLLHDQVRQYVADRSSMDIPEGMIQVYDSNVDARQLREGIWIVPAGSVTDLMRSHAGAGFVRRWTIAFSREGKSTEAIEHIEWAITGALAYLADRKDYAGNPLVLPAELSPLELGQIRILNVDPEREPLLDDPRRWTGICDVEMTFNARRSEIPTSPD